MKQGILGGTFDPVHNGHLAIAAQTMEQLHLDEVIFLPAGQPWLKKDRPISPAEHRLRMLQMAIEGRPHLRISMSELERAGDTYTIDTIAAMQAQLGKEDELFFIIGWDKLPELPRWRDVSRLLRICRLAAVPRPGYSLPDLKILEEAVLPGVITRRVVLLDRPLVDVSASAIRQRVAQGLAIGHLVPEPVERYIRQHGLYIRNA